MTRDPLVDVVAVSKTYRRLRRRVTALAEVSMKVHRGEVMVVAGRNGAGKTTLLSIIGGFIEPDHGAVRFAGSGRPRTGWLGEGQAVPAALSMRDLVAALCADQTARKVAEEMIAVMGLRGLTERRLGGLSSGQRRRAGLALALAVPGELSLLDEPLVGVDPLEQDSCKAAIRRAARGGRAILIATHLLAEIESVVDQVAILDCGKVLLQAPAAELRARSGGGASLREAVVEFLSQGGCDAPID